VCNIGLMSSWLTDPSRLGISLDGRSDPPIAVTSSEQHARDVPTGECGEPLVALSDVISQLWIYQEFGIASMPGQMLLRQGVLDRLLDAQRMLPRPFGIVVLDGWRPRQFQADLLSYYRARHPGSLAGYVSDPADDKLVPPHVTGGAVDLTLTYHGVPLALGTDYDDFTSNAAVDSLESVADSGPADARLCRDLRRLLARQLQEAGFACLPMEWWHWSYGDQLWAQQYHQPRSRYAALDSLPR